MKVSQRARRTAALNTFKHLHQLSLQFHLDRQTGGISRVIERGTRAIRFVLSFLVFNIGPTVLELLMVVMILSHALASASHLSLVLPLTYIFMTITVTEWRLKYRRDMNQKDTQANSKAVDSLLTLKP